MFRQLLRKASIRVGLFKRIKTSQFKYLMNFLEIDDGFIYGAQQIEEVNGNLVSTGNDPQILVCFDHASYSVSLRCFCDDGTEIEIFCSDDGVIFDEKDKRVVNHDSSIKNEMVVFDRACRFFRIDLTNKPGKIKIDGFKMVQNEFCGDEVDLILEKIPKARESNGYVVVTHAMDGTGAPLLALNICKELKGRGLNVVAIALTGGFLEQEYRKNQIPIINLHQGQIKDKVVNKEKIERLARELRAAGYCNLLTNTIVSGVVVPFFKSCDYRVISLIHEMKNSILKYEMEDGGRNIDFYADAIVFPDDIVKNEFEEVFDDTIGKTIVLPQGFYKKLEEDIFDKKTICRNFHIPCNATIIFGSGPAGFRKGIDLFFEAAMSLIKMEKGKTEYHFIWTGCYVDDEMKNWFEYQFEKMGVSARVHVVDYIKDKKMYQSMVQSADVFWLTSREDPFPSVMIEALMFDTPVVAFRGCGGADTLLSEGRGVLVDGFDVNEMANKTIELIKEVGATEEMISKAQKYIRSNLDFGKYIDKLIGAFDRINANMTRLANVSVIIPNYNYEKYLSMRIASIVGQTMRPKEIILLDDNSRDNSLKVAKPLLEDAKKRYGIQYRIIKNDNNQGCFNQWIKGFNQASCEYVWVAEADDYIKPSFIESMLPMFKDKSVMLAYCKSCVIDDNSVVLDYDYNSYTYDLDESRWNNNFICDGMDFVAKYLSRKNVIPNASSAIIRKSATMGIEEELVNYKAIGDWFAYIYIVSQGKVGYCSKVLNGHRRHGESIIAKQEKSVQFIKEVIRIKKYLIENYEYNDLALSKIMLALLNEYCSYALVEENEELDNAYMELAELYAHKKKRDNILIVLPDFNVGGGQAVGIRLANALSEYYNVFILNTREGLETDCIKKMISDDVGILKYGGEVQKLTFFGEILKLKAVLSFIWWSDKLAYLAFEDTDVKRIVSMHGCYENILDNPEIDPYFDENVEKMLKTADYVVYTAEKNKKVFEKKKIDIGERLTKIDNGFTLGDYPIKTRGELGIDEDAFVFGLVARGIPEKGYEQAIEGVQYINGRKNSQRCHLVLVGAGDYIDKLKSKYHSLKYVHFVDNTTEPLEWIGWEDIVDVGLLPSYFKSESMPTVIVEMLFLGKPIIATDIGEIKTMIVDDGVEAGIVVPLRDGKPDQARLNEAMLKMATNCDIFRTYKSNTKELAKRFDMKKCVEEYRKLIDD